MNKFADRHGALPQTRIIGDLTVRRLLVTLKTSKYIVFAVPVHAWKHPYKMMVFEDDGGNPGRNARLTPGDYRKVIDAVNLELGLVTEEYVQLTSGSYPKEVPRE